MKPIRMKYLTFRIFPRHIKMGTRKLATDCAAACAIQEKNKAEFVSVSPSRVTVGVWSYRPSPNLVDWITKYDNGKPVKPQSFRLQCNGIRP